jgi:hypothetical protein
MLLHGITFIGHITSETNGRFGVTPVFNQVIKKVKRSACSYRFLSYQLANWAPALILHLLVSKEFITSRIVKTDCYKSFNKLAV